MSGPNKCQNSNDFSKEDSLLFGANRLTSGSGEFCLSDKEMWAAHDCGIEDNDEDGDYLILSEDVKEFIKKLKENINLHAEHESFCEQVRQMLIIQIDKLAGEKLI